MWVQINGCCCCCCTPDFDHSFLWSPWTWTTEEKHTQHSLVCITNGQKLRRNRIHEEKLKKRFEVIDLQRNLCRGWSFKVEKLISWTRKSGQILWKQEVQLNRRAMTFLLNKYKCWIWWKMMIIFHQIKNWIDQQMPQFSSPNHK